MRLSQRLRELVTSNIVGTEEAEDDFLPTPSPTTATIPQAVPPTPVPAPPADTLAAPESPAEPVSPEPVGTAMSPEAVFQMIAALPESLPLRVRRMAVRNAIQTQSKAGIDLDTILGEATWKKIQILQQLQKLDTDHVGRLQTLDAQLARLTAQRNTLLENFAQEHHQVENEMDQMDQVIEFLGSDLAETSTP